MTSATSGSLTYTYLSDGTKVSAIKSDESGKRYVGSMVYSVPASGGGSEVFESATWDEGRIGFTKSGSTYTLTDLWFVKDHLGNVRSVVDISSSLASPLVVERNDYLPYGTRLGVGNAVLESNRYRLGGKEEQSFGSLDLGKVDFGARQYDPFIAGWTTIDPMAAKYGSLSPYNFCGDNPVIFVDTDGRDPIYAKNFWGKVKLIGDDGKNSTGSYLVRGSVARQVKKATKAGLNFTGNLSESKKVMHIPTKERLIGVKQSDDDTVISQKENGGHSLYGEKTVTRWDQGPAAFISTDDKGNLVAKATLHMFVIGGNNLMPTDASSVEMWWHTHPKTTIGGLTLGGSLPSKADYEGQTTMTNLGYQGNSFIIGVRTGTVTFFNKNRIITTVSWKDFLKMGGQEK